MAALPKLKLSILSTSLLIPTNSSLVSSPRTRFSGILYCSCPALLAERSEGGEQRPWRKPSAAIQERLQRGSASSASTKPEVQFSI
jgi:hypothetical protein